VPVAGAVYQFTALLGLREVARFIADQPRETVAIAMEIATAGHLTPYTNRLSRNRHRPQQYPG
jgi:hypothetical protein